MTWPVLLGALSIISSAGGAVTAPAPRPEEPLGVVFVPMSDRDASLAENITEVAMAKIAETPGRRLVGLAEWRRRSGRDVGSHLAGCLDQPPCLANMGMMMGVKRLVAGAVRSQPRGFLFSLRLIDISTGRTQQQAFKAVEGTLGDLMREVQIGVDQLLRSPTADARLRVTSVPEGAKVVLDDVYVGKSPLLAGGLRPGPHRVRVEPDDRFAWKSQIDLPDGGELDLDLGAEHFPLRRRWPEPVAYGAGIGTVAALASGAVFGALARVTPTGFTREDAQADLNRRITYGRIGTGLLIGGAVLAVTSGATLWRYWRDIAGE